MNKLFLPVAENDAYIPLHNFIYEPPIAGEKEGRTVVSNSDGNFTTYHFSKNLLTTSIDYYGQDGDLKKKKIFSWYDNNWLKSIEMRDIHRKLFYRKSYEYDSYGNPILEVFIGDLTGRGVEESNTTKRVFSEDGKNLLLKEENEDGKVVCFSYLPNTNLITAKLTKDHDRILLREFFVFDDCNNLIQTLSDDGSGEQRDNLSNVTQRTITNYILRQQAPFLHMPEWIEEKYWEAAAEKLLKKSHLIYDTQGNIAQEEVYDAEGKLSYIIYKTYNERGDLLSETNRLGDEATYTYDAKGRPDTSINFSHRLHTNFRHDTKGRLREQRETGDDGIVHVYSSEYDFYDRSIQKKDFFQNTTYYTYDTFVNQAARIDFPPIASIDGQATSVVTLSTYDPLGRELSKTDPNGNTTTYRYNAYNSVVEINYPNGSREDFRYTKKGTLASHADKDGLTDLAP